MTSRGAMEAADRLETVERAFRGFAYEGAAMGFAILDGLVPTRPGRLRAFIAGPAARHVYMAHVGAGWALARLPRALHGRVRPRDPLLGWLALDGYGFHEAYFRTADVVAGHRRPRPLPGWPDRDAARVIDQGIGRALWFVCGADVDHLATVIGGFAVARRADLWSGAGLAAAYAGGADAADLTRLADLAGAYRPHVAQGAAFAAQARLLADLVTPDTAIAVRALCALTVEEAARRTDLALPDTRRSRSRPDETPYETWRGRIREGMSSGMSTGMST